MTSRIDIIGQNGGDGIHYEFVPPCYQHFPINSMQQKLVNGCMDCLLLSKCLPKDFDDDPFCSPGLPG